MEYKTCTRCVMNNKSDKTITFDEVGRCNYCTHALAEINTTTYFPNEIGEKKLKELIGRLKEEGKGKDYDCMMGISGGLDSAYLAYLGYTWGLRILAVHIDDGFDTEISKKNIQRLVDKTGIKMLTISPDSEQYCDLTRAFIKAGVPNIAIPQDNILFAFLYATAKTYKIESFLSGGNFALECILQTGNTHSAYDLVNIKDIHKKFGKKPINKLKFTTSIKKELERRFLGLKTLRPLNFIDYNRDRAFKELNDFCGFEYYGSKHLENMLTAFAQLYWMPKKFGVDKRTSHLSSMIVSGQMTREQALNILQQPIADEKLLSNYVDIVLDKLHISKDEFENIMKEEPKQHEFYRVEKLAPILFKIRDLLK
ncbi:MAG: N-acetyl sugar amidotransferase [Clostridia bacterium]